MVGSGQLMLVASDWYVSEAPVTLSVVAPQAANPNQTSDLTFEGVTPDQLYTLAS